MSRDFRRARVRAYAKINLNLEVLHRRPDGYHEIRTIFHTISLFDTLDICFRRGRRSVVKTVSEPEISGNLVTRAAELVLDRSKISGEVGIALKKRVPMGAGLGGGSSDAAAVLLALPPLMGRVLPVEELQALGVSLGSDVPYFLMGGCALGLGRGEETYALDSLAAGEVLVVDPQVHVSTADAYRALARPLTSPVELPKINTSWRVALGLSGDLWASAPARCENDFEPVIFKQHPNLQSIKRKLLKLGARCALLSGSGSSLFGIFDSREKRDEAIELLSERTFPVSLLSRRRYQQVWRRSLRDHIVDDESWPPRSRYAR